MANVKVRSYHWSLTNDSCVYCVYVVDLSLAGWLASIGNAVCVARLMQTRESTLHH